MADIFVSYKREDRPLAQSLVRSLQERGFTVWWDSRIETGENWLACIKRALDEASCIIVVWTPRSVGANGLYASEIIEAEAEEGRRRNVLLPVLMQSGPLPFLHDRRQAQNLIGWQENADDPAFERLIVDISARCGERQPPERGELHAWLAAEDARSASAYRAFHNKFPASRFAPEAEPRAAEIEHRVADLRLSIDAAHRIVTQFAEEVSKPAFTPPLDFAISEKGTAEFCAQEQLFGLLVSGLKAVLHAGPGGGKTVKLLDWALTYSDADQERVGVFIRLKEVANLGDDLLAHLERLEPSISKRAWVALARSGLLTLFCDGWNELSDNERKDVGTKLDIYARTHPLGGLVIGSRPLAPPPLKGKHALLILEPLSYRQIRSIVESRLGEAARSALTELQESRDLVDLVRTPFFLFAFCETRRVGEAQRTREGLIRGMISAGEQLPEHAGALRDVLEGQQTKYLRSLAVEMLNRQQAELRSDDARKTVNRQSAALVNDDLIQTPPNAGAVLDTLRDHHFLIEHSGADSSYRFQHQLISEWYAADKVRGTALLALTDPDSRRTLDENILNEPAWTEATRFAVETAQHDQDMDATSYLILRAMGIAPGFAADLIGIASDGVWQRISSTVVAFVKEWSPKAQRQSIQFIARCGRPDFSSDVWQAIAAEMSDSVGQALHSTDLPHPGVLGSDWRAKCAALNTERRSSLLSMLASSHSLQGAAMAREAAVADNDAKVQARVAEMLAFRGHREELVALLRAAKPETWEELVSRREIDGLWDDTWRQHATSAAHRAFSRIEPGPRRIDFALRLRSLGEAVDIDFVSEALALKSNDYHTERRILDEVANIDGERLSQAVLEKILSGEEVRYGAAKYVRRDTSVDQKRLLALSRIKSRNRENDILSPLLDSNSVAILLLEFIATHEAWRKAAGNERNAFGETYGALEAALEHADRNTLAKTILEWTPVRASQIAPVADLMMRAYRRDRHDDERSDLASTLHPLIVNRLAEWAERLLEECADDRHSLHSLAEAIATFPSTKLLAPLRRLLMADLAQWRRERESFKASIERGEHPDPGSGARMSYAFRYGQNLLSLATGRDPDIATESSDADPPPVSPEMTDAVIDVLSEFLEDREFGADAARVIATLHLDPVTNVGERGYIGESISVVPARRDFRRQRGTDRPDPVALRLVTAVSGLRSDGSPEALNHAVKIANSAARMNCGEQLAGLTAFVAEHGTPELVSTHLMIRLLFGHEVDGKLAEHCLNQLDGRGDEKKWKWEYSESWYKWEELLVLMIFGNQPADAARRLLRYDRNTRDHDERRIVEAMGLCGHPKAMEGLEVLSARCAEQRMLDAWCSAVRQIGTLEAAEKLLDTLLETRDQRDWHRARSLSEMVAELSEVYLRVRVRILAIARSGSPEQIGKIAGIIRHVKDESVLNELLDIPGDRLMQMSDAIQAALHELCITRRPVEGSGGLAEIVPRPINAFRAAAFARLSSGADGSEACARLLMYVDAIRADYGETSDETRHPDIRAGKPWPPAALRAWEASDKLIRQRD